jgi:hypothetical protein
MLSLLQAGAAFLPGQAAGLRLHKLAALRIQPIGEELDTLSPTLNLSKLSFLGRIAVSDPVPTRCQLLQELSNPASWETLPADLISDERQSDLCCELVQVVHVRPVTAIDLPVEIFLLLSRQPECTTCLRHDGLDITLDRPSEQNCGSSSERSARTSDPRDSRRRSTSSSRKGLGMRDLRVYVSEDDSELSAGFRCHGDNLSHERA